MSRSTKSSLAALLIALGSAPATADGLELIGSGISLRAEVGTSAEVSDESSDIAATDLLTGTTLNIQGLYRWRNALGHEIRLEPGLTTTFFPSDSDLDDFDVSSFPSLHRAGRVEHPARWRAIHDIYFALQAQRPE